MIRALAVHPRLFACGVFAVFTYVLLLGELNFRVWCNLIGGPALGLRFFMHGFVISCAKFLPFGLLIRSVRLVAVWLHAIGVGLCANGLVASTPRLLETWFRDASLWANLNGIFALCVKLCAHGISDAAAKLWLIRLVAVSLRRGDARLITVSIGPRVDGFVVFAM